ncbi:phosphoribosyltransferase-like protein [Sphingopyxis sp.]|uniref:phosphoribosyltransferase-like protein n=1 Tax=Sphingopyxis sp. TaxID=1908224 RepID=UPI003F70A437
MTVLDELRSVLPGDGESTPEDTWDILRERVTVLSSRAWEGRNEWPAIQAWLRNFDGRSGLDERVERLHALFLLSQFLYIGSIETRVLLQAIYRDLFMIPLVQEIRNQLGGSRDEALVRRKVSEALVRTRFLGVGNPSESGVHLLYYFRQENGLSKKLFLDSAAVFANQILPDGSPRRTLAQPTVDRYVFVDDVCGSGKTAVDYSKNILADILSLKPKAKLYYLSMFASADGLRNVRENTKFGTNCGAVFELDESYRCLTEHSRIMHAAPPHIDGASLRQMALWYGKMLLPRHPAGYDDSQLLLGFHHNTPDNTLPIVWAEGTSAQAWTPAFRRYPKF